MTFSLKTKWNWTFRISGCSSGSVTSFPSTSGWEGEGVGRGATFQASDRFDPPVFKHSKSFLYFLFLLILLLYVVFSSIKWPPLSFWRFCGRNGGDGEGELKWSGQQQFKTGRSCYFHGKRYIEGSLSVGSTRRVSDKQAGETVEFLYLPTVGQNLCVPKGVVCARAHVCVRACVRVCVCVCVCAWKCVS